MKQNVIVYLGLGTNRGNREENLMRAIEELSLALGSNCITQSSFMETEPWGYVSDAKYLNCAVAFRTDKCPMELLDTTESIERKLGRTTKTSNGIYNDRIIDIDILLYGNKIVESERLTIPHPLMHKRDFVLVPLAEIAPAAVHPITGKEISQLLKELQA